jgi:hypothetical protein
VQKYSRCDEWSAESTRLSSTRFLALLYETTSKRPAEALERRSKKRTARADASRAAELDRGLRICSCRGKHLPPPFLPAAAILAREREVHLTRLTSALAPSLLAALLVGCAQRDSVTVTLEYQRHAQRGVLTLEPSQKERVNAAFKRVAEEKDYKCRPHVKRVEEITCEGPRKMNIRFQPDLSRPRYSATFTWLEVDDRTRAEFDGHVAGFVQSMRLAIADPDVAISVAGR